MLTRVRGGCVVHRCQNKNPRTRGCEWRHAPEAGAKDWGGVLKKGQLVESCGPKKKVDFCLLAEALWRVPHEIWGCRSKSQNDRNVYLSPYVEEPLNLKVIKSFLPELRSRKCFSCFGILMFYVYMLWTFYVHFTYSCIQMFSSISM